MTDKSENAGVNKSSIKFCDLRCPYASLPKHDDIDGSNSCRTFSAIYCEKLKQYVTKNAPCPLIFVKRRPRPVW